MTWKNYDPVERMPFLYKGLVPDEGVLIPTTDEVAWEHFHTHRWVYNRLDIAESQGLPCGLIPVPPSEFPVVVKPLHNLFGGGLGARVIHTMEEYEAITDPGLFWAPYQFGEHYSIDFILQEGKIVEMFTFRGEKLQFGSFDYWELIQDDDDLLELLEPWVEEFMYPYTGCLNVEVIGDYIIEAQLRMGDIDRLGDHQLMSAIHKLYNTGEWEYRRNSDTPETFFLAALFGQSGKDFDIDITLFDYIVDGELLYYQFDDSDAYHANPSHGNRVAIFCDDSWDNVAWARNIAIAMTKPEINGLYVQPLKDYVELSV